MTHVAETDEIIVTDTTLSILRIAGGDSGIRNVIETMVRISIKGLPLMYDSKNLQFAHTRRRGADGQIRPEGISPRYGAIVLLGIIPLSQNTQRFVLSGETPEAFCQRLMETPAAQNDLGTMSLIMWAAAELQHSSLATLLPQIKGLWETANNRFLTVHVAWLLSALVAARNKLPVEKEMHAARDALLSAMDQRAGIFPHNLGSANKSRLRSHVGCFADQVYPIQALARYSKVFSHPRSLEVANRCAAQICTLQGANGQWWWHYDVRRGDVIEGYPVYSVHQDAMAPMALLDLFDAGGDDYADAIRKGVRWMQRAPEVDRSLVDEQNQLIWRKVARREPAKASRRIRAAVSGVIPAARLPWLNGLFPPTEIDFESRPYHLGWVLQAWLGGLR
jgi:hypothetical protein